MPVVAASSGALKGPLAPLWHVNACTTCSLCSHRDCDMPSYLPDRVSMCSVRHTCRHNFARHFRMIHDPPRPCGCPGRTSADVVVRASSHRRMPHHAADGSRRVRHCPLALARAISALASCLAPPQPHFDEPHRP